jgi:hypothetical protein
MFQSACGPSSLLTFGHRAAQARPRRPSRPPMTCGSPFGNPGEESHRSPGEQRERGWRQQAPVRQVQVRYFPLPPSLPHRSAGRPPTDHAQRGVHYNTPPKNAIFGCLSVPMPSRVTTRVSFTTRFLHVHILKTSGLGTKLVLGQYSSEVRQFCTAVRARTVLCVVCETLFVTV